MAVEKMLSVTVTGTMRKLDEVLEMCCDSGCFHIEQASDMLPGSTDFAPLNESNPYTQLCTRLSDTFAAARLEPESCEAAEPPMPIDRAQGYVDEFVSRMGEIAAKRAELENMLAETERSLEQFRHFEGLDINLADIFACRFIKVRFGRLPKASYDKLSHYDDNPYIVLFPCTSDRDWVWGVYFAPIEQVAEVDRIFAGLYWERLHVPNAAGTPEQVRTALSADAEGLREQVREAQEEAQEYWEHNRDTCSKLYAFLDHKRSLFDLRRYVSRYHESDTFLLAGWTTPRHAEEFVRACTAIDGIECDVVKPDLKSGTIEPPVRLRNRGIYAPFEFYVKMYGLPSYKESDPTPFVALTFIMLFGMMFADVGQGIVLSLFAYIFMWKIKKMELGRSLALCGISSAFFGVILGSVFGFEDWLNPFWGWVSSKTGIPLDNGKLIDAHHSAETLIYMTVGIGALMMVIVIARNTLSKFRQRQLGQALFSPNGLAGLVFYTATMVGLVLTLVGYSVLTLPYVLLLIVLPLILIFLSEPLIELVNGEEHWMPKKLGDFFMQSFFEMFEQVLSYVSNTVSFLRIGAFILVHAGMMTVVFTLAEFMPEGSVGYIIVVIIGNIAITALEGLLVCIQTIRVEYYEMFSRYFTGGGREFSPVRLKK